MKLILIAVSFLLGFCDSALAQTSPYIWGALSAPQAAALQSAVSSLANNPHIVVLVYCANSDCRALKDSIVAAFKTSGVSDVREFYDPVNTPGITVSVSDPVIGPAVATALDATLAGSDLQSLRILIGPKP